MGWAEIDEDGLDRSMRMGWAEIDDDGLGRDQ